jgi:hypothetical protein
MVVVLYSTLYPAGKEVSMDIHVPAILAPRSAVFVVRCFDVCYLGPVLHSSSYHHNDRRYGPSQPGAGSRSPFRCA